jgi:hypothetical protein
MPAPPPKSITTVVRTGQQQYPSRRIYWEVRYHHRPGGTLRLGLPLWLPLSFALAAPIWWVVQRVQAMRRRHCGLCRECDLRASRDRCPECGTPIAADQKSRGATEDTEHTEALSPDPARRYATTDRWQISLK